MRKLSKKAKAVKKGLAVLLAILLLIPSIPVPAVWAEDATELEQTEGSAGQESVAAVEEGGDAPQPEGEDAVSDEIPVSESGEDTVIPEEQPEPEGGEEITSPEEQPAPEGEEETTIPEEQPAPEGGEGITIPEEQPVPEGGEETVNPEENPAPGGGEEITIPEEEIQPEENPAAGSDNTTPSEEDDVQDSVSENTVEPVEEVVSDSVSENTTEAEEPLPEKENLLEKMILHVGGDEIVVYPEEDSADDGGASAYSLQPLEEKEMKIDLTGYTPAELTMVSAEYILQNGERADASNIVWKKNYDSTDNYIVSEKGDTLDLSWETYRSYQDELLWEMIVGSADQLDTGNIRYHVKISRTESSKWLTPTVYQQEGEGNKTNIAIGEESHYEDYRNSNDSRYLYIYLGAGQVNSEEPVYATLAVNNAVFANPHYSNFKIFEGRFTSAAEAESQKEITEELCNSGYAVTLGRAMGVTMVTYDGNGAATGCLPFWIYVRSGNYISGGSLYVKNEEGRLSFSDIVETYSSQNTADGCVNRTYTLYAEYPAEDTYYFRNMDYCREGTWNSSPVTAAYAGQYQSIAEAAAAGAENIKENLFNDSVDGYAADYSKGVYFTIFVGEDGDGQEVYRYCITAKAGTRPQKVASDSAYVTFYGIKDAAGNRIACYQASLADDSYGDQNFYTMLVENAADLTQLAPEFSMQNGMNLYAEDQLQVSGESIHDFSKGAVQYTASSESKNISKNYWLQVIPVNSGKRLYINSLNDAEANTREENGIIYSTREMLLDSAHDYRHDILLFNTGTQDIENLAVELVSDTVELDEYWTLSGKYKLSSVMTVKKENNKSNGELSNMAKLRLRKKDGVSDGTKVEGTLTIKSGNDVLMVLTLTGITGAPRITTETVPDGVKYVPYGIMIQNNNKYSRNQVSYSLRNGSLPEGVELMPNGELYGVPLEAGEYEFTVRMSNSLSTFYNSHSDKTYTLKVLDNTNTNVDAATDTGYDLTQRVEGSLISEGESQTLVSQGEYAQFKYVFLDGVKLTEGTDFTSEAGSTRITIRNQTLALSKGRHTIGVEFRTQDGNNTLNRAAQNYVIKGKNSGSSGSSGGGDDDSGNGSEAGSDNGTAGDPNGAAGGTDQGVAGTPNAAGNGQNNPNSPNNRQNNQNSAAGAGVVAVAAGASAAEIAEMISNGTPVSYTIQPGETLWKIAEQFYGSGILWRKIFADNMTIIGDPNRIYAGQAIIIYPVQGTTAAAAAQVPNPAGTSGTTGTSAQTGTYYTVEEGDTLWRIARKIYGRGSQWMRIFEANRDQIVDPAKISVGQVIYIPE